MCCRQRSATERYAVRDNGKFAGLVLCTLYVIEIDDDNDSNVAAICGRL